MEDLIEEAREIIEMSLNDRIAKEEYAEKAREWLARAERQAGTTLEAHCAKCGNDLVCPSCG